MDTTFRSLKKGMHARVVSVAQDQPHSKRLQEMGFTVGAEFSIIKVAPLGDPIEIELRGYRLCLRKKEINGIKIELIQA